MTTETALDYFEATKSYIRQHGKPVCFYSDKHAIFRVSKKKHKGEDALSKTQFICTTPWRCASPGRSRAI